MDNLPFKRKRKRKRKIFIYKIKKIPKKEKKGLTFAKKLSILLLVTFSHSHRVRYLKGKKNKLNVTKTPSHNLYYVH